ncbi:MAG: hypothetical protein L6Q29_05215, partial [Candidatus Pacebacteria bacterium]|nr:hypothetical protein [Candidatus Paceibacterota bacterium]
MEQNDYVERHRKWQEVMISQLSNANNILLTLASGLLAFCFDKQLVKSIRIYLGAEIDWPVFFYAMSMVLLSLSLLYGILM